MCSPPKVQLPSIANYLTAFACVDLTLPLLCSSLLLRVFISESKRNIGLSSFLSMSLSDFGVRARSALCHESGCSAFVAASWHGLRRVGNSLLVWQNSPAKPSGPALCFFTTFFLTCIHLSIQIFYFFLSQLH